MNVNWKNFINLSSNEVKVYFQKLLSNARHTRGKKWMIKPRRTIIIIDEDAYKILQ